MDDIESAIQTYNLLSERWFTHATPTLFNAATPRPQMSSCFLVQMRDDSIEGIYDTLKTTALISKSAGGTNCFNWNTKLGREGRGRGFAKCCVRWLSHFVASGVGLAMHKIRASGSYIAGTNGHSNGLVPMLRVYNDTARFVNQGGGKRNGT